MREKVTDIPKDKDIYIHCRSGQRSYNMVLYLNSLGYKNVYNIAAGFLGMSYYFDTLKKYSNGNNIFTKPNFN
jgi:rhodanese-related sulfurtransferase